MTDVQVQPINQTIASPQTIQQVVPQVRYAGFWKRFLALLIDGLIWFIPFIVINVFASKFFPPKATDTLQITQLNHSLSNFIASTILILLEWPYFALLESSAKQATLGKMALGITVTDYNGNRISFAHATGRYFAKLLVIIPATFTLGIAFIIWYGMAGWTKKKQAVYDFIAKTLVISKYSS